MHPFHARVSFQRVAVEYFGSDQLVIILRGHDALFKCFDVLHHDAVAVFLENSVREVYGGWLAVREVDGSDFHEMLDLPQSGVVLGDVLDDCDVWWLLIGLTF